jgi:hypothetical protein
MHVEGVRAAIGDGQVENLISVHVAHRHVLRL